ncbi:MAG: phosphatidate cytidylyltransferase [Bacillota bacterium]
MKVRVVSAAVAIFLLAVIVYIGETAIGLAVFALAALGVREFNGALEKAGFKPVNILSYLSCLPLLYLAVSNLMPWQVIATMDGNYSDVAALGLFVLVVMASCFVMFSRGRYKIADAAVTLAGILYVVYLLSFVTLTRNMDKGYLYIWFIFIGAWATDTFAFFTGITIGKKKIVPSISPKKTLEGFIGGILGCMLAMVAFGMYFSGVLKIPVFHLAALGLVCGVISQLSDWSASAVKRAAGLKDYGNIMPGHGGVLDRVDSILFTAPAVYFYINIFITGVPV